MGEFCLLMGLHREGSALQPAQQACLKVKRTLETKRNSERAINSKLFDLIKVKQSPIYTNVDEFKPGLGTAVCQDG